MEDEFLMAFLILAFPISVLCALIPANIASNKGGSYFEWFLFGLFMFPIALICAILMQDKSGKKCPYCSEMIKKEALVCRFCGNKFKPATELEKEKPDPVKKETYEILGCPYCGKTIRVSSTEIGKAIRCPHCHGCVKIEE